MKAADRKAIKTVGNAATSRFAQHIFYLQNSDRNKWDHLWRSVRLACACGGYLRISHKGSSKGFAGCVDCNEDQLRAADFWKAKAQIVAHLFAGDEYGLLYPYILVEPRPLRVPA